jgi:predicted regulator of Ras-like GTPase activity (Roadblock/LC7/MglB family)
MSDYSAIAQRISASVNGIRGCLMLSRDGMVLGAHPEGEVESRLKSAWVRFAAVGEADRAYVEFPDQTWAFVRRGGYGAFAVADAGVRPGILVELLEQALMSGEQDRAHERESLRLPEAPAAPTGKPRTIMHKQERASAPTPEPGRAGVTLPESEEVGGTEDPAPSGAGAAPAAAAPDDTVRPAGDAEPEAHSSEAAPTAPEDEPEVDRILLAKEFAGLLQVPKDDDEATR